MSANLIEILGKVDEISKVGKVEEYVNELGLIVKKIYEKKFPIHLTSHPEDESHVKWNRKTGSPNCVKLRIRKNALGLKILWCLLHEYGHILDGYVGDPVLMLPDTLMSREQQAWDNAEKELQFYPNLLSHIEDFYEYRNFCLSTYRAAIKAKFGIDIPIRRSISS